MLKPYILADLLLRHKHLVYLWEMGKNIDIEDREKREMIYKFLASSSSFLFLDLKFFLKKYMCMCVFVF